MEYAQASSRRQSSVFGAVSGSRTGYTETKPVGQAKNVIYLMVEALQCLIGLAHHWQLPQGDASEWMQSSRQGLHRAYQDTARLTPGLSASAWGSVNNGSINVDPSGIVIQVTQKRVKPLAWLLVVSSRHAHFSTVPKRGMEDAIAKQYLEREIDIGGGARPTNSR